VPEPSALALEIIIYSIKEDRMTTVNIPEKIFKKNFIFKLIFVLIY